MSFDDLKAANARREREALDRFNENARRLRERQPLLSGMKAATGAEADRLLREAEDNMGLPPGILDICMGAD